MSQIKLSKCIIRSLSIKRTYLPVKIFYKRTKTNETRYLTLPFETQPTGPIHHVLVTTNNDIIAENINKFYKCRSASHPMLVPRAIGEEMNMDVVVLLKWYCNIATKEEAFDLNYIVSPSLPVPIGRSRLIEGE